MWSCLYTLDYQIEWDEHGYGERPERVSIWDIETPENTLVFPSAALTSKRQCLPVYGGTSQPCYKNL